VRIRFLYLPPSWIVNRQADGSASKTERVAQAHGDDVLGNPPILNLMEFKELTIEELKKDYMGRHGFIFAGQSPSAPEGCDKLCQALINRGITEVMAEFVVQWNPNTFVFVYPEGASFKSGEFFQAAQKISMMMGFFNIDTLHHFLRNN